MPSLETLSIQDDAARATKVLVIGGSYGGLAAALNLLDMCAGRPARFAGATAADKLEEGKPKTIIPIEIKVVDERDGYYHLIGSPLALAEKAYAAKAWQKFNNLAAFRTSELSYIQGSVVSVDCKSKIATIKAHSGEELKESYDYLVAASGLRRAWPTVPQSLTQEEYIKETNAHIEKVENAKAGVVVIGGGAVGIEMAAELKLVQPDQKVTLIHSRAELLSSEPLPSSFKAQTLATLQETGVEVILNDRVVEQREVEGEYELTLKDGKTFKTGHVIWAISKQVPTSTYLSDEVLNEEGYVKVSNTLNFLPAPPVTEHNNHFALGDIVLWSGIRRCGGAMHMGHVVAINIHQQLLAAQTGAAPKFRELAEFPAVIALAVGKKAVLYGPAEGVTYGEKEMDMMFGNDLGWSICWNYLALGRGYEVENKI
ncbi:hypothetical protein B0O99DRAFT_692625 [Bisporella sp. PMI_857]|nr:hypothetical protein B0O99DRAFT_692625 [Bisporella sp. PMI_857]